MLPFRVTPFFFLMAALIGWLSSGNITLTMLWMIVIFISVLFHECGHATSAVLFGQSVEIHLVAYGGVTYRHGPKLSSWREFVVVMAGPLFGAILSAAAFLLLPYIPEKTFPYSHYFIEITAYANAFWTVLNLLPTQPLDGGKLVSIPLEAFFGIKGLKITFLFSLVFSLLVSFYFFSIGAVLGGAIFLILAFENFTSFKSTLTMTQEDQDQTLWEELKKGQETINKGNVDEAYKIFESVASKSGKGVIHTAAVESLASILRFKGNFEESYRLFETIKENLSLEYLKILQEVAFKTGRFQEALDAGGRIYRDTPDSQVAIFNAKSHAKLGMVKAACGWIKSAFKEGYPSIKEVLGDSSFDGIRLAPEFQELLRSIENRKN